MKPVSLVSILLCALYSYSCLAQHQHILLPDRDIDLVGTNGSTVISREDTLIDVAVKYHLGYNMIRSANPHVDSWLPDDGSKVLLPFSVILPDVPRQGIVINTPEMRLYYYHKDEEGQDIVSVYPISVGRRNWATPITETRITLRVEDPPWYPPESIRAEHAERGDILPRIVPAGPDNPLGHHLLGLGVPSYFIHGTNKRFGIGMQVTHGCIRMYPEHIEALYNQVSVNTPVVIINQPHKLGWRDNELYLEVHHPLELDGVTQENSRPEIMASLTGILESMPEVLIDWDKVDEVINKATGVPVMVGKQPQSLSDFDFYESYREE